MNAVSLILVLVLGIGQTSGIYERQAKEEDGGSVSINASGRLTPIKRYATSAGSWVPGEWGWRRPQGSLAPCFSLERERDATAGSQTRLRLDLDEQCAMRMSGMIKEAAGSNVSYLQYGFEPVFYVRLVGAAIIIGEVHKDRSRCCAHSVTFTAHRPGIYMLDVILEFSAPSLDQNLAFYKQARFYEGNHIPGSPFEIHVAPNFSPIARATRKMKCEGENLGRAQGEWVLEVPATHHGGPLNFTTAKHSWEPNHCYMPDLACLVRGSVVNGPLSTCLPEGKRVAIAMVGDSVMRKQAASLANILGEDIEGEGVVYDQVTSTSVFDMFFQATNDGLKIRMGDIKDAIARLLECQEQQKCLPVLLFNSGLHDLDKYCGNLDFMIQWRAEHGMDVNFDCVSNYVQLLQEVIDYVNSSAFHGIKIFRSTTAAWLKFGNYRVNWFQNNGLQAFINSWVTVASWNDLAVPIFEKAKDWHIIDGFQSSIGRPDHTERHPTGAMVHFEREVPDAHNHQLLSVIFERICPKAAKDCAKMT